MKKSTINKILLGIILLLIITICILIICIITRPRYTVEEEPQTTVITEIPVSDSIVETPDTQPVKEEISGTETKSTTLRGKTSTKVNIRELPSQDARVLETVDAGTEYDILEIMESGWVKIQYTESLEAYISSSYIILLD